ncbi:hypothetical protein Z957_08580 [Clostridium sp. K25]|uniref:Uncharacterized protein n=1 Tax=Clostridium botulinum D str. 1873 TaxID=592027 RepID=A0A9P2G8L1_CLOBO|nr:MULTISPECIES: hypothetical protein [Clostridium]AYF53869.1 hypothetical protein DFH04_03480 [Clostridium novyi]EES91950.1 conserved hypothetical protein [Clostridium botulinum D str. 1873]KEI07357.1 hypothetical protein Z957_08580 [Clostridium sp. K25]MCD3245833.1 hypothetical protein [Clostridium botulinum C]MCD3262135.1 hypothetical protein [Clostridium botulinum C]
MENNIVLSFSKAYKDKNIRKILSSLLYIFIISIISFKHIQAGKGKIFIIIGGIILIGNFSEMISGILEICNIKRCPYIRADEKVMEVCIGKVAKYETVDIKEISSYTLMGTKDIILNRKNNDLNINLSKLTVDDIEIFKNFLNEAGIVKKGAVI